MVNHLIGLGYFVHPVDLRRGEGKHELKKANLVIVSVPIQTTPSVLTEVTRYVKTGAIVVEIASFKDGTIEPLMASEKKGFVPLCVHPMFGPSTKRLDNKIVAIVPLVDLHREIELAEMLFPGAELVVVDAQTHDEYMAFAKTLEGKDLQKLHKLGGTTYTIQYVLAQSVVAEKIELVEALLSQNRRLEEVRYRFLDAINQMIESMKEGRFSEFHMEIRDHLKTDPSYLYADENRRQAYNAVKDHWFKKVGSND